MRMQSKRSDSTAIGLEWNPEMNRLLIVSENPEFRSEARSAFGANEQICFEARDGLAALQEAVEMKPKTIVLDAALAGLTAVDLRDRLSRTESTAGIKVWIVSHQMLLALAIHSELAMTNSPPAMLSASG